jgi:nucleotide-binding universal stress UspA family protein
MKILIAADGSEFSRKAIVKACRLLNFDAGTEVKVVSVYEQMMPMATEPFAVSAQYYQEMTDLARRQAEVFAADSAELIRKSLNGAGANVETIVLLGAPSGAIVEEAANWGAELIVVGSHGRGFWGRLTLGSVSDAIIHHAPCSVLIARG